MHGILEKRRLFIICCRNDSVDELKTGVSELRLLENDRSGSEETNFALRHERSFVTQERMPWKHEIE